MLRSRIIPCLLVSDGGLVKTTGFSKPVYIGDQINAVKIFNEKQADELIVLDIDATVKNKEPDYKMISRLAAECRMPLSYGGGIKTVDQAKKIVSLGVEKVSISSAAIENHNLVRDIAKEIGSQSVVVVLDIKKRKLSRKYDVYVRNAKQNTKQNPIELAKLMEENGAGEIVINSIDNDGKMSGYDLAIAKEVRNSVTIPVTVLGGAGSLGDIEALINECGIIGAAAGSLFVFKGKYRAVLINYPDMLQRDEMHLALSTE